MHPDDLILQALKGDPAPWPGDAAPGLESAVITAAAEHGVAALLAAAPAVAAWPDGIRSRLATILTRSALVESMRREELTALLEDLHAAGIRPLVLKGAQLAYTRYTQPWLRPREDADLLVAPGERARADAVLRTRGYTPRTHFGGELVTHQFLYERPICPGVTEQIDLHWKIANPQVFAGALTFDELERDAAPVAALGPAVRGPSNVHALILACVHRVAHHDDSERLIWLYDIHLITTGMGPESLREMAGVAASKRMRSVCAHGLDRARALFGTDLPQDCMDRLRAGGSDPEPSEAFLGGWTKADVLLSDLRSLRGWRPRLRLIREHLFPPPAFVRQSYGVTNTALLPWAYAHRIATGVRRWFDRSD